MTTSRPAVGLLCLIVTIAGCDSSARPAVGAQPSPLVPPSLSGQVVELIPGGRAPAANMALLAVVVTDVACAPPCVRSQTFTYHWTSTDPDGRYNFPQLPAGGAVILPDASKYSLACAAAVELRGPAQLNVEITSSANPQRSPVSSPLRVTGQIYEMTPVGRIGVSGATIGMDHHGPDAPFYSVVSDADGRYTACGIPAGWPIAFWTGKPGYDDSYVWHQFNADSTVDIELTRR
jgi:hypothetical protein